MTRRTRATELVEVEIGHAIRLGELARMTRVHAEYVIDLVEEGVLAPRGRDPREWEFGDEAVWRVRTARNLQRDLGVNLAGVALVLELLSELRRLRAHAPGAAEGPGALG